MITREQMNLIPKSDRLIALLFKSKDIYAFEDNIFGYYTDKLNSRFVNFIYYSLSIISNLFFIILNYKYIKNYNSVYKIFYPKIYTSRKNSNYRVSVYKSYKQIIQNESVNLKNNQM